MVKSVRVVNRLRTLKTDVDMMTDDFRYMEKFSKRMLQAGEDIEELMGNVWDAIKDPVTRTRIDLVVRRMQQDMIDYSRRDK